LSLTERFGKAALKAIGLEMRQNTAGGAVDMGKLHAAGSIMNKVTHAGKAHTEINGKTYTEHMRGTTRFTGLPNFGSGATFISHDVYDATADKLKRLGEDDKKLIDRIAAYRTQSPEGRKKLKLTDPLESLGKKERAAFDSRMEDHGIGLNTNTLSIHQDMRTGEHDRHALVVTASDGTPSRADLIRRNTPGTKGPQH